MFINCLQNESSPDLNFEKQKRAKPFTHNPPLVHTAIFQTVLIHYGRNKICKKVDSINSNLLGIRGLKENVTSICLSLNPALNSCS